MIITREMLLTQENGQNTSVQELINYEDSAKILLAFVQGGMIVWSFYDAPYYLRKLCCWNGGDEDWLVLTDKQFPDFPPMWIEQLDTCQEPDIYSLDGVTIYVGSHS